MSDRPYEPLSTEPESASGAVEPATKATAPAASSESSSDPGSTAQAAQGEAKQVAGTAVDAGKEVAATAKEGAQNVAAETKQQARSLLDTVRSEVGDQAGTQQNRIADALHGISKELGGMASSSEESGPLTDLAQQASRKGGEVAHWLQEREPADVLEALRSYGRRHPVTFLALCGLAGVVAGRLTRSAVATRTNLDNNGDNGSFGGDVSTGEVSTGVYGGSVESTEPVPYGTEPVQPTPYGSEPVDPAPYGSEPPIPRPGRASDPLDNPSGGPIR